MRLTPSGSQTVGPFFRIGLEHLCAQDSHSRVDDNAEKLTICGRVLDGEGIPVPDAVLEIWHADAEGHYSVEADKSGFAYCFARAATDENGNFSFSVARPVALASSADRKQAPHLAVLIFARGLLRQLMTRMYFPDEPANGSDPVLQLIPEERRFTLIARKNAQQPCVLDWDVVLQGRNETVFFLW